MSAEGIYNLICTPRFPRRSLTRTCNMNNQGTSLEPYLKIFRQYKRICLSQQNEGHNYESSAGGGPQRAHCVHHRHDGVYPVPFARPASLEREEYFI